MVIVSSDTYENSDLDRELNGTHELLLQPLECLLNLLLHLRIEVLGLFESFALRQESALRLQHMTKGEAIWEYNAEKVVNIE